MEPTVQEHTATVAEARRWAKALEPVETLMGKRFPARSRANGP